MFRSELPSAYRSACLTQSVEVQATTLNLLLEGLLSENRVQAAHKLAINHTFPGSGGDTASSSSTATSGAGINQASNNQVVRNLYYRARINALQLEYAQASQLVGQVLRKCPVNRGSLTFRVEATN